MCVLSRFSHVWLFATLWTVAHQATPSMGFSRQEYWSGLPCPPSGDLPDPGIEPTSLLSPAFVDRFFTISATWETQTEVYNKCNVLESSQNQSPLLVPGKGVFQETSPWCQKSSGPLNTALISICEDAGDAVSLEVENVLSMCMFFGFQLVYSVFPLYFPIPYLGWLACCMHTQLLQSCLILVTPWTVAYQTPLSMGFSRQEYWSGLPFLSPRDLSNPGIEPHLVRILHCRWVLYHWEAPHWQFEPIPEYPDKLTNRAIFQNLFSSSNYDGNFS